MDSAKPALENHSTEREKQRPRLKLTNGVLFIDSRHANHTGCLKDSPQVTKEMNDLPVLYFQ